MVNNPKLPPLLYKKQMSIAGIECNVHVLHDSSGHCLSCTFRTLLIFSAAFGSILHSLFVYSSAKSAPKRPALSMSRCTQRLLKGYSKPTLMPLVAILDLFIFLNNGQENRKQNHAESKKLHLLKRRTTDHRKKRKSGKISPPENQELVPQKR
jgi:hypothetical protein